MQISIPSNCPTCGSNLEVVNSQLFCRNKSCEAQTSKLLEGFCKKLKLKGFGEKTLEKLGITTIVELYQLTKQDLVQSTSDTVGSKLYVVLENSKSNSFEDFIKSLGINLIGATAAPKIVKAFPNPLAKLTTEKLRKAGLGEKAAESFMNFYHSERGQEILEMAAKKFTFQVREEATNDVSADFPPTEVCITGTLLDYKSRTAAAEYLSQFNITVKGSVTKSVSYLVCEDDTKKASSSYKKALSNHLPITTIKELVDRIVGL